MAATVKKTTKKQKPVADASLYSKLEKKLLAKVNDLSKDKDIKRIKASLLKGRNELLRVDRLESGSYDMEWVYRVEDCLPELGQIINNPKKTIKTVTDIVPVELAKKTGPESIRHLSMNSQFVKSVDKKGNITPEKILNISSDDDYHIYENKFIATLIKSLVIFVEKRYEYIKTYAPFTDNEILMLKNESVVDGSKVQIEVKVKVEKSAASIDVTTESEYVKHVDKIRTYMLYYYNSDFMKMFKNEKMITGNIIMTNILRKNPAYHKCYELFKFIQKYSKAGLSYNVNEVYHNSNKKHIEDMTSTLLANFLALEGSNPGRKAIAKERKYEPKILTTTDDKMFVFKPISNKPIEFIRIDDEYKEYIEETILDIELKKNASKEEHKYYEEELKRKHEEEIRAKSEAKLIERKRLEEEEFERLQDSLIQAKMIEDLRRKQYQDRLRAFRVHQKLEEIRKMIKDEAREDRKKEDYEQKLFEEELKKAKEQD